MEKQQLRNIIEGALLAYAQPLTIEKLHSLFVLESTETDEGEQLPTKVQVEKNQIVEALEEIQASCGERGFELKQVASGWRFQVREETAPWVNKLWEEKPQRYSRALMETLAIIAYRQPITRGDIEEIRGVAVSSNIIRTLSEREWVKVVGQRDVPGRPSLYATTKQFLDYFNLHSLDELPSLKELTDIESLTPELELEAVASEQTEKTSDEAVQSSDTEIVESEEGVDPDASMSLENDDLEVENQDLESLSYDNGDEVDANTDSIDDDGAEQVV